MSLYFDADMKILIISDVHANRHALEAVLNKEAYDALIFLGDAVDFGPDPKSCVRFLIDSSNKRFWGVRGDHDHAMAYGINSECGDELNYLSRVTRDWGEGFLVSEEVGFLRRLPVSSGFTIDGMDFELTHSAAPNTLNPCRCEYESEDIGHKSALRKKFKLTGHSHKPFIRKFGATTVLNPGSVGQPRDLDPRASYAVIENGEVSIRRVSYDIEKTVYDLERSALPYEVKGRLTSMLLSGAVTN
jgi:putative phosphoesterase